MLSTTQFTIRIALLGDNACGKTAIVRRYCWASFNQEYKQTIGLDIYTKTIQVNADAPMYAAASVLSSFHTTDTCNLEIWDVGGQTLTSKSSTNYIHAVDAIIFVYDTTHIGSLRGLEDWLKHVYGCKMITDTVLPMFALAANKADLTTARTVHAARHEAFALHHQLPSFIVSAKTGDQIDNLFQQITHELLGIASPDSAPRASIKNTAVRVGGSTVSTVAENGPTRDIRSVYTNAAVETREAERGGKCSVM